MAAHTQTFSSGLPEVGFVRQAQLIPGIIPFSHATLWRKVARGEFPKPVKLSERVTAWDVRDIRAWLDSRRQPNCATSEPAGA
jgi:predicted DNA-binding transcriptional regulator AlpA